MRFLTWDEILELHALVLEQSGGGSGLRDAGALEAALAQPRMTFAGQDLYPTLIDKAACLGYSLIRNHPFIDGNKRIGHAAMELFLVLHWMEIAASVDEQEQVILNLAAGQTEREEFTHWLSARVVELGKG